MKRLVPRSIVNFYRKIKIEHMRRKNQTVSVKDVFTSIYKNNEWCSSQGRYFSGSGSSEYHASLYADVVKKFIKDYKINTLVDLGCGDFAIGNKLQINSA